MLSVKLPSHLLGSYVKGIFRFSGQLHVNIVILTRMFDVIRILSPFSYPEIDDSVHTKARDVLLCVSVAVTAFLGVFQ